MRWLLLALLLTLATPARGAVPHAAALARASHESGVSFDLLAAVARVESRFDAGAVAPDGSVGLMQLQPRTGRALARRLGIPWAPFDPTTSARLGAAYLGELLRRYGCPRLALAAYNMGPGRVDRLLRAGRPVPERYARRVLNASRS